MAIITAGACRRKLVRILVDALFRSGDARQLEHFDGLLLGRVLIQALVENDSLYHLGRDLQKRVEGGHRILEDHGNLVAPYLTYLRLGHGEKILAVEKDLSPAILPGGVGMRLMTDRFVTLLPEPDSPTIPRVSPLCRSKLTPSTAFTRPSSTVK
jgi:hypothetical protein